MFWTSFEGYISSIFGGSLAMANTYKILNLDCTKIWTIQFFNIWRYESVFKITEKYREKFIKNLKFGRKGWKGVIFIHEKSQFRWSTWSAILPV